MQMQSHRDHLNFTEKSSANVMINVGGGQIFTLTVT